MAREGRTATLRRPRASRRREVHCPSCGTANDAVVASWCGHCGERLRAIVQGPDPTSGRDGRDGRDGPDLARVRMLVIPAFVVFLVLLLVIPAALRGNRGVPHGQSQRGDPGRSGVISDHAPAAPREVAWELATSTPVVQPAGLSGGPTMATVLNGSNFEVLDIATGRVVRTVDVAATSARLADARAFDDLLLLPTDGLSQMDAVDLLTGAPRWSREVTGVARYSIDGALGLGPDLVMEIGSSKINRVSGDTGTDLWSTDLQDQIDAGVLRLLSASPSYITAVTVNPASAEPRIGSVGVDVGLVALSAQDGSILWTQPLSIAEALEPVVTTNRSTHGGGWLVHTRLTDVDPELVVRDLASGREQARIVVPRLPESMVVLGDTLVVSDASGVRGFHARSGNEAWVLSAPSGSVSTGPDEEVFLVQTKLSPVLVVDTRGELVSKIGDAHPTFPATLRDGMITMATDTGAIAVRDTTGARLWQRTLTAQHMASMVTDGDLVAVNGQGGTVVLDGRTGAQMIAVDRRATANPFGIDGSIAIHEGIVVSTPIGTDRNGQALAAFIAQTGIALWNEDGTQPPVVGPLTRVDDLVFVPVDKEIHAYDIDNGRRAFAEFTGIARGPVLVAESLVISTPGDPICAGRTTCNDAVIAIARNRDVPGQVGIAREVVWTSDLPACGPAASRGGRVIVPTTTGPAAIDIADGSTLWRAEAPAAACGPAAVAPDHVVQTVGTSVRAWNIEDGTPAWSVEMGQTLTTEPVIAGGEVVVTTADGDMISLRIADGEIAWQYRLPAAALADPVVVDDHWVVLLRDGRVLGLR